MFFTPPLILNDQQSVIVQTQTPGSAGDLVNRIKKDLAESPDIWPVGWPGSSMLTPTGFNGTRGMIGVGLGLQVGERYDRGRNDGLLGIVVPVGDPVHDIGFDVVATADHLHDPWQGGSFDFIVHKRFGETALAIGSERLADWGAGSDSLLSYYAVASHVFHLETDGSRPLSRLTVSLGIGTGRFQSENDALARKDGVGVFGSASVRLVPQLSFFAEWTGQDMDLGLSYVPFKNVPLIVSGAAVDVTGSAGDGVRASFGVGYIYRY